MTPQQRFVQIVGTCEPGELGHTPRHIIVGGAFHYPNLQTADTSQRRYEVVGDVNGTFYDGPDQREATHVYNRVTRVSNAARYQCITLLCDGEILAEHINPLLTMSVRPTCV